MITALNRKEVYCGISETDFNCIRSILIRNMIDYKYKLSNRLQNGRGATPFLNGGNTITYYIYVHKKDYEDACFLIENEK